MGAQMSVYEKRRALNALRHIVQALRVSSRASERAVGMSTAQLFVLRQIASAGTCSISELAARTLTHPSSVSVVVSRLVDKGLVERKDAPEDRRRVELSCTEAGLARLADGPPQLQDRMIAAFDEMDPPVLTVLTHGLELIAARVSDTQEEEPVQMFFDEDGAAKGRRSRGKS